MNPAPDLPPSSAAPLPARGSGRLATRLLVAALIAATIAYYFWTSIVSLEYLPHFRDAQNDHFNLLARGFRQGQLSLAWPVPPELLDSKNPYDPALRPHVAILHDASYYRGKYYIYFGPAPAVTLFLPFAVLTGRDLPMPCAVWLFVSGGYLALVALFFHIQRRHFPNASRTTLLTSLLVLGGGTMTVALLRRPNMWEVAGASGFFYFTLSLLCLVRALSSRRAPVWTAVGGLALGLAVASRPTYAVCALLFALPLLWRKRSAPADAPSSPPSYGWSALVSAAVTCGLIGVGLLVYNYARFDHPLEFGQKYQLSSIIEGDARHFSASYVAFNVQVYLLSSLQWFASFPFVRGIELPLAPAGQGGHEFAFGVFPNLPFVVFGGLLLPLIFLRWLRGPRDDVRWPAFALLAASAVLNFVPLAVFFGSCIRYMADFTPSLMLLACCGLLEWESRLRFRPLLFLFRGTALALAAFTSLVAALAIVHAYDVVPGTSPPRYAGVAHVLNSPVRWFDRFRLPEYRPWEIKFTLPADRSRRTEPLLTLSKWADPSATLFIDYLDPHTIRFGYREALTRETTIYSPPISAPPLASHTLRITLGETATAPINGVKSWLRLHCDGRSVWETPAVSLAAFPGTMGVARAPESLGVGVRFTGQILSAAPVDPAPSAVEDAPPQGARLRFTPTAGMLGRSLPVATTGATGMGDILIVRLTAPDQLVFVYDHWGSAGLTSPPIPVRLDQPHVVEFWLPALAPATPASQATLVVKVDGQPVWTITAPFHRTTVANVFFGHNPIGGTSSERVLENGVFESTHLPFPPK